MIIIYFVSVMKKIWQVIGGLYVYLFRKKWLASLMIAMIVIAQFVLIIFLGISLKNFRAEFNDYKTMNSERMNQIYSYMFVLNSSFNKFIGVK